MYRKCKFIRHFIIKGIISIPEDYTIIPQVQLYPLQDVPYASPSNHSLAISPNTNLTYPNTTLANCKSNYFTYSNVRNAMHFTLEKQVRDLSKQSTCLVVNSDLPVPIHNQSHQLPFQECWSVRIIHKFPKAIPDHVFCQFETAYQLCTSIPTVRLVIRLKNNNNNNNLYIFYFTLYCADNFE